LIGPSAETVSAAAAFFVSRGMPAKKPLRVLPHESEMPRSAFGLSWASAKNGVFTEPCLQPNVHPWTSPLRYASVGLIVSPQGEPWMFYLRIDDSSGQPRRIAIVRGDQNSVSAVQRSCHEESLVRVSTAKQLWAQVISILRDPLIDPDILGMTKGTLHALVSSRVQLGVMALDEREAVSRSRDVPVDTMCDWVGRRVACVQDSDGPSMPVRTAAYSDGLMLKMDIERARGESQSIARGTKALQIMGL
jgi:hypothetical protein